MFSYASSLARSGAVALIALASLQAEATAGPIGMTIDPTLGGSSTMNVLPVAMGEGRDHGPGYWPRIGGGRHWNGGGRHWNGGGNWNGGWHGRRGWRGGHWNNGWGPGFALGLGLGIPLGYYGGYRGYDGYYDDYYDGYYDRPIYRPRVNRARAYYQNRRYYNNRRYDNEERRNHCDNAYLTGPNFFKCDR